jgi:hypothetical protein
MATNHEQPWGSSSEVWATNIPAHLIKRYTLKNRKDIKEHELA